MGGGKSWFLGSRTCSWADAEITRIAPKLVAALHPAAEAHFERIAAMFRLLVGSPLLSNAEDAEYARLKELARTLRLTEGELSRMLADAQISTGCASRRRSAICDWRLRQSV
jgi:hypothetical protein